MATLDTAITRVGLGGPSKNYSRPFSAKSAADVVVAAWGFVSDLVSDLVQDFVNPICRVADGQFRPGIKYE